MKKISIILVMLIFTCSVFGHGTPQQAKQANKQSNDKNKQHHPHHHEPKPGEKK